MLKNLKMNDYNHLCYFTIPSFEEYISVTHCFTSRIGGVSNGDNTSLNLSFKTGDTAEKVRENYERVCNALNIPMENLVLSDQVHGDRIKIVSSEDRGKGILMNSDIYEIDALITNEKNVALVTLYADCVPIFILDPKRNVIALAHAGWKGTVLKIGAKVINRMKEEFSTDPKDCIVAIGPSIGNCCYEVDQMVIDEFNKYFTNLSKFVISKGNNKYMLDLWKANKLALEEIGVLERNITVSNICTQCNHDILFSHRADKGKTGRMAGILQLR